MTETNKVKRQHLVNLHGTTVPTPENLKSKDFRNGEIAVQHGSNVATSALHILNNEQAEVITFLPKGQDPSYASIKEVTENAEVAAFGISKNAEAIAKHTTNIDFNTASIKNLNNRTTTVESTVSSHDNRITVNEQKIAEINATIIGGTHFIGIVTGEFSATNIVTDIYPGGKKPEVGDIVIKSPKEYIFSAGAWAELGDVSAERTDINEILDGTKVVGKATSATNDANGNNIVSTYATKDEIKILTINCGAYE